MDLKERFSDFDKYFNESQKAFGTPGCSICVTKGDEVILSKGFGFKDLNHTQPVDGDTQFFSASCTKGFVALAAAILVEEGKLSWTQPIVEYLPWFRLYDNYATHHIRLIDILSHQSGLPDEHIHIDPSKDRSVQECRKEITEKIRHIKPSYDIHTEHRYNNTMYAVAAYIVGEAAGMAWEDFVKERIFKPLGMNNSFFSLFRAEHSGNCSDHHYFNREEDKIKAFPKQMDEDKGYNPYGAAGSITSTSNDIAKYMILLANGGRYKDQQILSEETIKKMFSGVITIPWDEPFDEAGDLSAAAGWFSWGYRGHIFKEHPGVYGSMFNVMKRQKIGVAVFANYNAGEHKNIWPLVFHAFDCILGLKPIDWIGRYKKLLLSDLEAEKKNLQSKDSTKQIPENTIPSHPLQEYCGKFENKTNGIVTILKKDDSLYIKWQGEEPRKMKHAFYDTFTVYFEQYNFNLYLGFIAGFNGKIEKIMVEEENNILLRIK